MFAYRPQPLHLQLITEFLYFIYPVIRIDVIYKSMFVTTDEMFTTCVK